MLPKSTVILAGDIPLDTNRFETDKRVGDLELVTLLQGDLWKKEDKKKAAKKDEEEKKQ